MPIPRFRPPSLRWWCLLPLLILLIAASLLPARPARAADTRDRPIRLAAQPGGLPLVDGLAVFEDAGRTLDIDTVRTAALQDRFAYPEAPLRGRESDRVLWFRLRLQLADPADALHDWALVVPTVSTHDLRFYGPYDEEGRALAPPVATGMRHPWSTRPLGAEQMAWRFRLPDARPYTVYFRVESTFARIYDVRAWRPADYLESTQDKRMFDGASYGMLFGLVVYALVLLIVFREAIYAWYLLSCVCALFALAGFNGHTLRYPFAHWPAAAWFTYLTAPPLWAICKLQFGRQLLRLGHFAPRLDRLVRLIVLALVVATGMALAGVQAIWMFRLVQASVLVSTGVLLAGAAVAVRRRYWPAVLYCAGVALLLAGISAIVVASWGWIAWAPGQMDLTQAALVAELVVFAAATASRLRLVLRSERQLSVRTRELVEALGTDALTGVASRAGLEARAAQLKAEGRDYALMLLDLDGFKPVNDTLGHAAGDVVLAAIAQRLRGQVRAGDVVARLGGDEFAVLVAGVPPRATLAALAERMTRAAAEPVDYEGRAVSVGMSLGVACGPADGFDLAALLRAADRAMYHCKQQPGQTWAFAADLPGHGMPGAAHGR